MSIINAIETNQSLQYIRTLLDNGSDIEETNNQEQTPLHLAISQQNIPLIKLLLKYDADYGSYDRWGVSALHRAVEEKNLEIVKLLVNNEGFGLEMTTDNTGDTVLVRAIRYSCQTEVIEYLILCGAELNVKLFGKISLLTYSIGERRIDVVKLLLDNGADINFMCDDICILDTFTSNEDSDSDKEMKKIIETHYIKIQTNLYIKISKNHFPQIETISLSILLEKLLKQQSLSQPLKLQYHQQYNLLTT